MPTDETVQQLDVGRIRQQFPALESGIAFFDGAGGTQTPMRVADAIRDTLLEPLANRGGANLAQRNAERAVIECREALADFLGVESRCIVFGRSMTSLTFDVSRALAKTWQTGDEIILTRLEHDSNVYPWMLAAERSGASIRWADFDPDTAEFDFEQFRNLLSERTKLVAVTGASNVIGTMPNLRSIAEAAHAAGALIFVDGVHYSAHALIDIKELDIDLFVCSPYKFYGPHCGVLAGKPEVLEALQVDKLRPSPDNTPERFELGTLPYELMAGTTAAIAFIADVVCSEGDRRTRLKRSITAIVAHEHALCGDIEEALRAITGARLYARSRRRTPTLFVDFAHQNSAAISTHLASRAINAPAGSFYALEPCKRLGLGVAGAIRISVGVYTNANDVERLIETLSQYIEHDGKRSL